ncbi:hypothetical protein EDB89DRAFT_1592186 [Lactarius sanguifluus]|nr:hypothetical protein EDB89DRAFT_1592186 [Lactarius sanguifluus]
MWIITVPNSILRPSFGTPLFLTVTRGTGPAALLCSRIKATSKQSTSTTSLIWKTPNSSPVFKMEIYPQSPIFPFTTPAHTKMLPIPMFLLLVFSVAILAPAPAILIHFMKSVSPSAPPSHILTMPALPSTSLPPAVETLYLPIPDPQPTLDIASVCLSQSFVDMAPIITAPPLRVHEASDFTTQCYDTTRRCIGNGQLSGI